MLLANHRMISRCSTLARCGAVVRPRGLTLSLRAKSTVASTVAGGSAVGGNATVLSNAAQPSSLSMAARILNYAKEQPYMTNIIVATVKTAVCDLLVQRYIEGKEAIDWKRNAVFTVFGFAYLGVGQWFIYQTLFKRLFPGMGEFASQTLRQKLANPAGIRALFGQVALDNFVHYPVVYFPIFYTFKEYLQCGTAGEGHAATFGSAMSKYKVNAFEDNTKMWMLWVPGDLMIYAVPLWMRLPLNHGLSFIWTCYLSFLRGGVPESK